MTEDNARFVSGEGMTAVEITCRRVRFVSGDEGVVQSAHGGPITGLSLDVLLDSGTVYVDVDGRDVIVLDEPEPAQQVYVEPSTLQGWQRATAEDDEPAGICGTCYGRTAPDHDCTDPAQAGYGDG